MAFASDIVSQIATTLEAAFPALEVYAGVVPPSTAEEVLGVLSDRGNIDRPRVGTHRHEETVSLYYARRVQAGDLPASYAAATALLRDLEDEVRSNYRWSLDTVYGSDLYAWSLNATPVGVGDGVLLEGVLDFTVATIRPREYDAEIAALYGGRRLRLLFNESTLPLEDAQGGDNWTGDVDLAGLGYGTFDGSLPGSVSPDTASKHFAPIYTADSLLLLVSFAIDADSGEGPLFELHKPKLQGDGTLYLRASPTTLSAGMLGDTPGAVSTEISLSGLTLADGGHVAGLRFDSFSADTTRLEVSLDDEDAGVSAIFDGAFNPEDAYPTLEARIGAGQNSDTFKGRVADFVFWDSTRRVPPDWGRKQSARWLNGNATF